jgi:hypothetical protein
MRPFQVRLTVEDGLATIVVGGLFDLNAANAVTTELHDVGPLADAVLIDLEAVTQLTAGFDLPGFLDEVRRYCRMAGCGLTVTGKDVARTGHRICADLYRKDDSARDDRWSSPR